MTPLDKAWGDDIVIVADEVSDALVGGRPVVGLESSAFAHGFSRELATDVYHKTDAIIRENGAVPALIYLCNNRIHVGAKNEDLIEIAGRQDLKRFSRSTLVNGLQSSSYGVTTVSSSMMICDAVGIRIFSVGGIGGVHRGAFYPAPGDASVTLDVSPDLQELTRTPVVVVSSGPKSFLDVAATAQWLETRGVPLVSLETDFIPGYLCVESAERSPIVARSISDGALLIERYWSLKTSTGLLFCVPVPQSSALSREGTERVVDLAIREVEAAGIRGSRVTAAVLEVISRETAGRSVTAQADLIINNGRVAARLAQILSTRHNQIT